jgi:translation initiation factor 5B
LLVTALADAKRLVNMVKKGKKKDGDYWSTEFEKDLELLNEGNVSKDIEKVDEKVGSLSISQKDTKSKTARNGKKSEKANLVTGGMTDGGLEPGDMPQRKTSLFLNLSQGHEEDSYTSDKAEPTSPVTHKQVKTPLKKANEKSKRDPKKKSSKAESDDEFEELERLGLLGSEGHSFIPKTQEKVGPTIASAEKPSEAKLRDNAQEKANSKQKDSSISDNIDEDGSKSDEDSKSKKKTKSIETTKSGTRDLAHGTPSVEPTAKTTKRPSAMIAAIKEAMARQKAEEERIRQAEELKRQAEEEARRREEEAQRQQEEERQRKKEKEREKKERLRKEGKLLNRAEKERLIRNAEFLESLKLQGFRPDISKEEATTEVRKKIVYDDRKKRKSKLPSDSPSLPVEVSVVEAPPQDVKHEEEFPVAPDNWEDANSDVTIRPKVYRPNEEESLTKSREIGKNVWTVPVPNGSATNVRYISTKEDVDSINYGQKEGNTKIPNISDSPKFTPQTRPCLHMPVETPREIAFEESAAEKDLYSDQFREHGKERPMANAEAVKPIVRALESRVDSSIRVEFPDRNDENAYDHVSTRERELMKKKDEARLRKEQRHLEALASRSKENLRSPICCVLGHVDTGKTKLLDKIRQTNVQEGEAGGITQQIGATYFPAETIREKTECLNEKFEIKVPGLLIIDTPGHESFANLRTRGSSLCNIAILVVDIMHGLEPQTIESLNLLRQKKTPFIVALNKIDRCYNWQVSPNGSFVDNYEHQPAHVKKEFEERLRLVITLFAEQGLNAELYTRNSDMRRVVSLVPTSAITGEGIPDLLKLLVDLTQRMMSDKLMYLAELECTVLEVKVIPGLGTTIDVILSNGVLREGDTIVLCGLNGPIVTTARALLTPQPCRELRIKSAYIHHKEVKASLGVKICGQDLDKAIAGSRLLRADPDDDIEELKDEVMEDLTDLLSKVDKSGTGVSVQASTLGSLEALLEFLKSSKIPVSAINIGPVFKKDVMRAAVMLEHAREYASILAFDVRIEKEAEELAQELGVRIFRADIIYHLFDQFTAYMKDVQEKKRADLAPQAVFPCILRIVPNCVFNKRDPIIMGIDVVEGTLKVGTPLCVPSKEFVFLGKVSSIEINHKPVTLAKKGQQVAIKIECPVYENPRMFGRHFDVKDELVSKISRQSIDILKENFRNDMTKDDWMLVVKLKSVFSIV